RGHGSLAERVNARGFCTRIARMKRIKRIRYKVCVLSAVSVKSVYRVRTEAKAKRIEHETLDYLRPAHPPRAGVQYVLPAAPTGGVECRSRQRRHPGQQWRRHAL